MEKNREIEFEVSFLEAVNISEISERFANDIIRDNYPGFISKNVIINYHESKKWKKSWNWSVIPLKLKLAQKRRKDLLIT